MVGEKECWTLNRWQMKNMHIKRLHIKHLILVRHQKKCNKTIKIKFIHLVAFFSFFFISKNRIFCVFAVKSQIFCLFLLCSLFNSFSFCKNMWNKNLLHKDGTRRNCEFGDGVGGGNGIETAKWTEINVEVYSNNSK